MSGKASQGHKGDTSAVGTHFLKGHPQATCHVCKSEKEWYCIDRCKRTPTSKKPGSCLHSATLDTTEQQTEVMQVTRRTAMPYKVNPAEPVLL